MRLYRRKAIIKIIAKLQKKYGKSEDRLKIPLEFARVMARYQAGKTPAI